MLGAILAPWLFWAGQYASHFQYLAFFANTDFQRYFNRSILVSAFLLLIPLLRSIGLQRLRNLGLRNDPRRITPLARRLSDFCVHDVRVWEPVCCGSSSRIEGTSPMAPAAANPPDGYFRGVNRRSFVQRSDPRSGPPNTYRRPAAIFRLRTILDSSFFESGKQTRLTSSVGIPVSNCCRTRSGGSRTL